MMYEEELFWWAAEYEASPKWRDIEAFAPTAALIGPRGEPDLYLYWPWMHWSVNHERA